jgi:2-amino-4-hydroxy-6-hydroxymethyldihydropteridine diphosphokinase
MEYGIFLLLGSNQGNADRNLAIAREHIAQGVGAITSRSSIYRSAAWGMEHQPDFLNQVLEVNTLYCPEDLLEKILAIEQSMGRIRTEKWGPRLIDIDLLFYNKQVISTTRLHLPHPGIPHRRFTLEPLAEIAPEFIHPVLKKSVATLLKECTDNLHVQKLSKT